MNAKKKIVGFAAATEGVRAVALAGKRENDVIFSKSQELKMIIK